jgi:cyclopropane fatty-acyl-phospholipid synthase-like methyltransferase
MTSIKDERGFNQIFIDSPAARIRKKRRFDYMISKMDVNKPDLSILEIGSGTGEGISYITEITNATGIGLDLSAKFTQISKNRYLSKNLNFIQANFNESNINEVLGGRKFDYIIGNGILHHLYYNLDSSLINLKLLLKPQGKLIFIEPNLYNPYVAAIFSIPFLRRKTFLEPDEMAFSKTFIKKKCKKAGFTNIEVKIKDFLLPTIPDYLIGTTIKIGEILEKTPLTVIAQSLYITAE